MKKSSISIYLIFSIFITIIGILLIFVLIGKNTGMGKKIYCQTSYQRDGTDPFCDEYLNLKVTSLKNKESKTQTFNDKRDIKFFDLKSPNSLTGDAHIRLPINAEIKSAKIDIKLAEKKLVYFDSGLKEETIIFPIIRSTISKKLPLIPQGTKITKARFEISGAELPTKAQVVFVIDTSGSMSNEWAAICSILNTVEKEITDLGLQIETDVYGIGDGDTYDSCIKGRVTPQQMNSITQLVPPSTARASSLPPYDYDTESWAPASGWLAANYPNWVFDTDNKRIVIPISDSDPTGGGQTTFDGKGEPYGPASFTGTETKSINDAVLMATRDPLKWVYIIPVTGDESPPPEGYGVGGKPCTGLCSQIVNWMNDIAGRTGALSAGAEVVAFSNSENLLNSIIRVMTTPFPKDVEAYLMGSKLFEFPGELNEINSPQVVDNEIFTQNLNNFCIGKSCDLDIMSNEGTVILNKLVVRYVQNPQIGRLSIGGIDLSGFSAPNYDEISRKLDIKEAIEIALDNCPKDKKYCDIPIEIFGARNGAVELENLNIEYDYYDIEEDLVDKIIECWISSNKGNYDQNIICEEMVIGNIFTYDYPITEQLITQNLKDKNFCHIFENVDYGCGNDDMLEFQQDLFETHNILIEYSAEEKKIIVS